MILQLADGGFDGFFGAGCYRNCKKRNKDAGEASAKRGGLAREGSRSHCVEIIFLDARTGALAESLKF
jgi:hypothetical protein